MFNVKFMALEYYFKDLPFTPGLWPAPSQFCAVQFIEWDHQNNGFTW